MKIIVYSLITEMTIFLIMAVAFYIKCVVILKGSKDIMENENNMLESERMKKAFSMIEEAREIIHEESQKIKAQESKKESRDQKESAADSVTEEKNNYHKLLEEEQKTIYTLTLRFTASGDKVRSINTCLRANGIRIKVLEKEVKKI